MSDVPHESPQTNRGNGADHQSPPPSSSIFDDLDALRLDPAASLAATKEHLVHVPVRKPGKLEFFRTHPDPAMSLACTLFTDDEERENYIVMPVARPLLLALGHLKPVLLVTSMSRQNTTFIWPVPLPTDEGTGGGFRAWGETARQAADLARTSWIRMQSDRALGAYRLHEAEGVLPGPVWPDHNFSELLKIGFKDRIIGSSDHPVIRKLRGLS